MCRASSGLPSPAAVDSPATSVPAGASIGTITQPSSPGTAAGTWVAQVPIAGTSTPAPAPIDGNPSYVRTGVGTCVGGGAKLVPRASTTDGADTGPYSGATADTIVCVFRSLPSVTSL